MKGGSRVPNEIQERLQLDRQRACVLDANFGGLAPMVSVAPTCLAALRVGLCVETVEAIATVKKRAERGDNERPGRLVTMRDQGV